MRVITVLTTFVVVVTSFSIRRHANSVDNDPLRNLFDDLERQLDSLPQLRNDVELPDDIELRINSNGMTYLTQQLLSSMKHDVTRHAPSKIHTSYLGMELYIEPIQIVAFRAPTMHLENDGSRLRIILKGAKSSLLAQYTAKYRTNREGQLDATLDEIDTEVEVDLKERKITAEDVRCSHVIGAADIKLNPPLPPQISQLLKDEIVERVGAKVCPSLQAYVARIIKVIRKSVRFEEPLEEEDLSSLIPNLITSSISDKKAEIIFNRRLGANRKGLLPPREGFSMASVSVSTEYINDFLRDLADKGDIIFHLDRVPKIRDQLRLECGEGEELCLGSFTKLNGAVDGTGRLESKAIVAPKIEIKDGTALLKWKLLTVLSYQNQHMGRRVKYLQFHLDLVLKAKDLRFVDFGEEGHYNWVADYSIEHLEMSRIATYFDSVRTIAGKLPHVMENYRKEIEALISDHLTTSIPLTLNNHIRLSHEGTQLQDGQITFEFNFKADRKLFPTFGFS